MMRCMWLSSPACCMRSNELRDGNAAWAECYDFALVHDDDAARVFENGGNVRGQKLFVFAQANDKWTTTVARADQEVWLFLADYCNGVGAGDALQSEAYRCFKIVLRCAKVIVLDQV